MFGKTDVAGDERKDRPNRVRRLRGHPDRELARHLVEMGNTAASLNRRNVNPRNVDVFLDRDFGFLKGLVGSGFIAPLPVPYVIVLLALLVGAKNGRIGEQRFLRVDDDGQRIVVNLHCIDSIGRHVARGSEHGRYFLSLIHDFLDRQYHLRIGHQRRHPVKVVLGEILAGDDRGHAGNGQRFGRIDIRDLRVSVRAAHDVEVEHIRQHDVIDVVPLASQEARVLFALDGMAHPAYFR